MIIKLNEITLDELAAIQAYLTNKCPVLVENDEMWPSWSKGVSIEIDLDPIMDNTEEFIMFMGKMFEREKEVKQGACTGVGEVDKAIKQDRIREMKQ